MKRLLEGTALRTKLALAFGVFALLGATVAKAQELRISDAKFGADQKLHITFPAATSFYYILYRGTVVTHIFLATDASLGPASKLGELTDRLPRSATEPAFFRILQVPVMVPLDSDGDGIDDVYELQRRTILDPLNGSDGEGDFDGDGQSNRREYLAGTDPLQSNAAPLTQFTSSPANGERDVAVTRKTILRFSQPLAERTVLRNAQFYATGGRSRIVASEATPILRSNL